MYAHLDHASSRGHAEDAPGLRASVAFVITLATSVEALDATARTVMSTELMPGEDPALLSGPDRIEIHHVTGYHVPSHLPSSLPSAAPAASLKEQ